MGTIIAMLAEEGDDISNIELPSEEVSTSASPTKEEPTSSSSASPPPSSPFPAPSTDQHARPPITVTHDRPLFPSVIRLLRENGVSDARKIRGTGIRGMLTKGDVLAHLGLASSPWGTAKQAKSASSPATLPPSPAPKKAEMVRPNPV